MHIFTVTHGFIVSWPELCLDNSQQCNITFKMYFLFIAITLDLQSRGPNTWTNNPRNPSEKQVLVSTWITTRGCYQTWR